MAFSVQVYLKMDRPDQAEKQLKVTQVESFLVAAWLGLSFALGTAWPTCVANVCWKITGSLHAN